MTGTDPAVEAAQRAWAKSIGSDQLDPHFAIDLRHRQEIAAAREALAEVRKLHRKSAIFQHVDGCDNQDAEHERLWHFEATNGELVCQSLPAVGWTCSECADLAAEADDLPDWPCDTARLIYSETELTND